MWTLQIIEHYEYESEAGEALDSIAKHVGYLGGSVAQRGDGASFYIQAFFPTSKTFQGPDSNNMSSLPDGAKAVYVPALLQRWYGFTEAN